MVEIKTKIRERDQIAATPVITISANVIAISSKRTSAACAYNASSYNHRDRTLLGALRFKVGNNEQNIRIRSLCTSFSPQFIMRSPRDYDRRAIRGLKPRFAREALSMLSLSVRALSISASSRRNNSTCTRTCVASGRVVASMRFSEWRRSPVRFAPVSRVPSAVVSERAAPPALHPAVAKSSSSATKIKMPVTEVMMSWNEKA